MSFLRLLIFVALNSVPVLALAAAPTVQPTVKIYDQKPGQVLLYWTPVPTATSYEITTRIGTQDIVRHATDTRLVITGLQPDQLTTFAVAGKNADGAGPQGTATFTQPGTAPADPVSHLQFSSTKDGRVVLRWAPSMHATLHRVRMSDDAAPGSDRLWVTGGTALVIGTTNPAITTNERLQSSHVYRAKIRGANAAGVGPESEVVSRLDYTDVPTAVDAPVVTILSPTVATASWQPIPQSILADVFVGESSATLFAQAPRQVFGTTLPLTDLDPTKTYYIAVRGQNSQGAGVASPISQFQTLQAPSAPVVTATPTAPYVLMWNLVSNVTRYAVEYTINGVPTTIDPATTPYSLPDFPPSSTIKARVQAINPAGQAWSDYVTILTAPDRTSIFQVIPGAGRIGLHWNPVAGATAYNVYLAKGVTVSHSATKISTVDSNAVITNLSRGTYTAIVTVQKNGVESADSDPVSTTIGLVGSSRLFGDVFGNGQSLMIEGAGLSATGRFSLFFTAATNLSMFNTGNSLMVHDQELGTVDFVGPIKTTAGRGRYATTPDGNVTAFTSNDDMIVFDDTNNAQDVFLVDISTGEQIRVSVDESGQEIPGSSNTPFLSDDGNEILFMTSGLGGGTKPYIHHRQLGYSDPGLITFSGANGTGTPCGFSANGKVLAVLSLTTTSLQLDDNPAFNGLTHLYVSDLDTGITRGESASSDPNRDAFVGGTPSNAAVSACALAHDASYAIFETTGSNLVPGDTNAKKDVFLRNLITGHTERVSLDSAGGQLTDNASLVNIVRPASDTIAVVFKTKAPVKAGDVASLTDRYYIWSRHDGHPATVSSLLDPSITTVNKVSVSRDGSTVAIETTQSLDAQDTNGLSDIYLDSFSIP